MCSAAMLNLCCARLKLRLRLKSTWTPPRPSWSEPPKVRHHHEELEEQRAPPDLGHLPMILRLDVLDLFHSLPMVFTHVNTRLVL